MHGIIFSFVHAVIILTVSFFVLSYAMKQDVPWLKNFGFVVAVLLWFSAALVFGKGVTGHDRWEGRGQFLHSDHKMWNRGPGMTHMMPGQMNAPTGEKMGPNDTEAPAENSPVK